MIPSRQPVRICATHLQEAVMAKGQMRVPKEKKKPKADKDKTKPMSAYKASQSSSSATVAGKK